MTSGLWLIVGWSAGIILLGVVFFVWAWRNGQFKNVEEAKYRMLEDREPEPWPNRKERQRHG